MVEAYKDVGDSISTLNPYTMASFKSIDIFVEATRTFLAEKGNETFNRNDYIIYFSEDLTKKMESAKKVDSVKMQDVNINEAETFVDKDNGNSEDDKFDDNDKKLNINKNKFNLN